MHSEKHVTGSRKTRFLFALRHRVLAAAVLSGILLAPLRANAEAAPPHDDGVVLELSALGNRGEEIARAREQVLEILRQGNACAAWFRESDPDSAEVFQSLHFEVEEGGPSRIYGMRNSDGDRVFKHPWGAKSFEYGGRDSTILLNANGPFFQRTSILMQADSGGLLARPAGITLLAVSRYSGNTPEAQITILLHELGHITGRLPEDDDSLDGRSARNTSEVLRHCKTETRVAVHKNSRRSN